MVYVIALISVIAYSLMGPIGKQATQLYSPFTMMSLTSFGLLTISTICAFIFERDSAFQRLELSYYLIPYIICNFVGYFCFIYCIRFIPVIHYELVYMVCPIIAGIAAYFLLGEAWDNKYLISIALVSIGIYIAIKH